MAAEATPYYEPGSRLTGYCTAAVNAKRFLVVSAERHTNASTVPPVIDTQGNNISVAQATAGATPIGVAAVDGAIGDQIDIICDPGTIVPVTAAGTISYGQKVSITTDGKVIAQSSSSATFATVDSSGTGGANNQLRYTAKDPGVIGNGISVRLRDPAGASAALSITVNGNDIVVNLATDAGSVVISTAAQVKTAIEGNGAANAMITVAHVAPSTGAGVVVAEATPKQLANGAEAALATAVGLAVAGATTGEDAEIKLF